LRLLESKSGSRRRRKKQEGRGERMRRKSPVTLSSYPGVLSVGGGKRKRKKKQHVKYLRKRDLY